MPSARFHIRTQRNGDPRPPGQVQIPQVWDGSTVSGGPWYGSWLVTQVPGINSPGVCPLIVHCALTVGGRLHSVWTASCCSELSWKQCLFVTPRHILSTISPTCSQLSPGNQHHCLTHRLKLVTKAGLVPSHIARNCSAGLVRIKALELVTWCISLLQLL